MFSWDALPDLLFLFFSRYMAGFSVISVMVWVIVAHLRDKDNLIAVRDGVNYMVAIVLLAATIFLLPREPYSIVSQIILWFSFTVLLVLEILWIVYLIISLINKARIAGIRRLNHESAPMQNGQTPYSRFPINKNHL